MPCLYTPSTPRKSESTDFSNIEKSIDEKLEKLSETINLLQKEKSNKKSEKDIMAKLEKMEANMMIERHKEDEIMKKEEIMTDNPILDNPLMKLRKPIIKPLHKLRSTSPEGFKRRSVHDETEQSKGRRLVPMDKQNMIGH
jgi:hypothetical protein